MSLQGKSYDLDGNITTWSWTFGDGSMGSGSTVKHTYTTNGTYQVTLTVTDDQGAADTETTTCTITQQNRPPTAPVITGPTKGTKNTLYLYTAVSTDADNDMLKYTFAWSGSESQSSKFISNNTSYTVSHSWATAGRYNVTVTVTDNQTTNFSKITVYIDALQIGDIGYLLDNDGDGIYDAFYSEETKQTMTIQKKDSSYLIDSNGDGKWDYTYDTAQGMQPYEAPLIPGFELVFVLCAIAVAMFLWSRKRNI
jgi:PKD repeat protein